MLIAIAIVGTTTTIAGTQFVNAEGEGNAWGNGMGDANKADGSHGAGSGFSDSTTQGAINSDGKAVHIDGIDGNNGNNNDE